MESQQQRRFRAVVFIVAAMSLLLLLLIPHAGNHHGLELACFVLLPVFLFGRVDMQERLWTAVSASDGLLCPSAARPSLFQRPPPSLFA